jgi:orotate phosphoribosyltransferase
VAFGICEAIRAKQVYWAESEDGQDQLRFWQFLEHQPYEPVILVDDMLRSGNRVLKLKELLEARGAQVMGIAVVIYQPTPTTRDFGTLPLYYLATLEASYYADGGHCELCRQGRPLQKVWS